MMIKTNFFILIPFLFYSAAKGRATQNDRQQTGVAKLLHFFATFLQRLFVVFTINHIFAIT
jgi:hypothetical protein